MKHKHIQSILEECEKQLAQVSDPANVAAITSLFNLLESLVEQTEAQAQQIQTLKDEINQLKGEQGKPNPRKQSKSNEDECDAHSSEEERKKREPKKPRKPDGTKKSNVTVDRTVEAVDVNGVVASSLKLYRLVFLNHCLLFFRVEVNFFCRFPVSDVTAPTLRMRCFCLFVDLLPFSQ